MPIVDVVNHDDDAVVQFDADERTVFFSNEAPLRRGDEAMGNYGEDIPDSQLLMEYGFARPSTREAAVWAEFAPKQSK